MADDKMILRINELAKKKREVGLTPEELLEQQELRNQYIADFRRNTKAVLDTIVVEEKDGTKHPLQGKDKLN